MIVHVCTPAAWASARDTGLYDADSLPDEGFIHLSRWDQLAGTVERHYAGAEGLIVLVVDPTGLAVRVENGFPHLYEPLPVSAVREVMPLVAALERAAARTSGPSAHESPPADAP